MHFPSFTMVVSLEPSHFTIHPSSRSRACSKVQGRVLHGTHIREIQPGTILDEQLDLGQGSLQQIPYRYTKNRSRYVQIEKYTYTYNVCMYVCMYGWMDGCIFRGFSWLTPPGFETMLVGLTLHQLIHTNILKKWKR